VPTDPRTQLVDATWAQIRVGGLSSATSRAITAAAGANLGAITYYFGSKDTLIAEALVGRIEALIDPALQMLTTDGLEPASRVLGAAARLQASLEWSADDAPGYLEAILQSRHGGPLGDAVRHLFAELRGALAVQMTDLKAGGYLPDWVEPDAMAGLLLAVAQGVVGQTIADPAGPGHGQMADQFVKLLLASRASGNAQRPSHDSWSSGGAG
jgi:AcrR family transcriptional regulator